MPRATTWVWGVVAAGAAAWFAYSAAVQESTQVDPKQHLRGLEVRHVLSENEDGTHVPAPDSIITGADIEEVHYSYEYDPRGVAVVTLTHDGGERFAAATEAAVGRKLVILLDGREWSAPVVNEPIHGGVLQLSQPPEGFLPQPRETTAELRAGFAAVVGGLALLVVLVVGGFAPGLTRASRAGPAPWDRLVVTVLAVVAAWAVTYLRLVTVHLSEELRQTMGIDPVMVSTFALGLVPFLSAFVLVELVALALPGLRWRRVSGPAARAPLTRGAVILGMTLALVQGWLMATTLQSLWTGEGTPVADGWIPRAVTAVSLAAGSTCLYLLARTITRHGLGNGFAVLTAAGLFPEMARLVANVSRVPTTPLGAAAFVGAVLLVTCGARLLLAGRLRTPGEPLRLPTGGLVPVGDSLGTLLLLAGLGLGALHLDPVWWHEGTAVLRASHPAFLAVLAASAVLYSWLFSRPRRHPDGLLVGGGAPGYPAFWIATAVSTAVLVAMVYASAMATRLSGHPLPLVTLVLAVAVGMDLVAEWRARRGHAELVPVWELHRVQEIDAVLRRLRVAGIGEAHPRTANARALTHFFGPHLPVEILVPAADAALARRVLEPPPRPLA